MIIMKNILLILVIFCGANLLIAQNQIFKTYQDKVALQKDAENLVELFTNDLKKIEPTISFDIKSRINTTPYLIYYDGKNEVSLPYWEEVIPPLKQFLTQVSGSEEKGKEVFGLFFNGFYIPHELGHALEHAKAGDVENGYESEYFANTIAILWWRKQGKEKELKKCYEYTKEIIKKLPNPIPEGQTMEQYFSENYRAATQDPAVYGFFQFTQFIKVYEDKTLPDFDTFVSNYLQSNSKNGVFKFYEAKDSTQLLSAMETTISQFKNDVEFVLQKNKIDKKLLPQPKAANMPFPGIIALWPDKNMLSVTLWEQVAPPVKQYLLLFAGNEDKAKELYGLLFYGYCIAHELGHWLDLNFDVKISNDYNEEYFANQVAVLWWKKQGKEKEVKQVYEMMKQGLINVPLVNPENKDVKKYLNENYWEFVKMNPGNYNAIQSMQVIEIYEDKTLPDFDTFILNYMNQMTKTKN